MAEFKFKQYRKDVVYLIDDITVEADNLQEAKDKLIAYCNEGEKYAEDIDIDENVDFDFKWEHNCGLTIRCCHDNTETLNGKFVKDEDNWTKKERNQPKKRY